MQRNSCTENTGKGVLACTGLRAKERGVLRRFERPDTPEPRVLVLVLMRLGEESLYSADRERSPELPEGEESFHSTRGDKERNPWVQWTGIEVLVLRRQGKDDLYVCMYLGSRERGKLLYSGDREIGFYTKEKGDEVFYIYIGERERGDLVCTL
jgi:hypothetical protein